MTYIDLDEDVVAADRRAANKGRRGFLYFIACTAMMAGILLVTAAVAISYRF